MILKKSTRALPMGLLAAILLTSHASAQSADKTPALKDVYKHHFYVGAAISRSVVTGEASPFGNRGADVIAKDVALVQQQFDQISPENDLKWQSIHPQEGKDGYNFGPADDYVNFGLKNHMFIVGHTLVWHGQTPDWVFAGTSPTAGADPATPTPTPPLAVRGQTPPPGNGAAPPAGAAGQGRRRFGGRPFFNGPFATRDQLLERMHDHITTVVGRYRGKIRVWDVVNECVSDGGPDILRNSLWRRIIGPDFVAKAFEYAHEADPKAILRLNDYGLENPAKRQKFIALVKQLQAEKVPISAIGTQTHVSVSYPSPEQEDQELADLETLGLPIHITELDVNGAEAGQQNTGADVANNAATTQGGMVSDADRRLADQYANLFKVFLKHKAVKVVTMWGVNDAVSWRADGKPLLFDGGDQPKLAFYAVIQTAQGGHVDPVVKPAALGR
jgi:endo-1,4-beta-xylanase